MPTRGAAYWLWEEEQEARRRIDRLTEEVERLESEIVRARAKREDMRLVVVEMQSARSMIEASGLKVEMRDGMPHVSVDKVLTDLEPAVAALP